MLLAYRMTQARLNALHLAAGKAKAALDRVQKRCSKPLSEMNPDDRLVAHMGANAAAMYLEQITDNLKIMQQDSRIKG